MLKKVSRPLHYHAYYCRNTLLICGANSQQHFQMSCGFTSFNKQTCKNRYEQTVLGFQKQGEATKVSIPAGKKLPRGLKLLKEILGTGNAAQSGDRVTGVEGSIPRNAVVVLTVAPIEVSPNSLQ